MITRQDNQPYFRFNIEWLRSPWCIFLSVSLSVYVGMYYPALAQAVSPIGELYLSLLKMCVLPILLSAITASIARLMSSPDAKLYIRRILLVFPLGLLFTSSLAVMIAGIFGPGRNLSEETLSTLGVLVNQSGIDLEVSLTGPLPEPKAGMSLANFLLNMVPENIFNALSEGHTLKVLCFAIIFGISLGLLNSKLSESLLPMLDATFKSFNQLIQWLTLALPFGLFSLLAYQLSQQGIEVVISMLNFILVVIGTTVAVYALSTLVIWQQGNKSLLETLSATRETTILALATSSSLACLPSAISTLSEKFKFNRQTINLVTPLSITLCRFGSVFYFSLGAMFVAQLYGKVLGPLSYVMIICGAIFAGMATSGVTGILTLAMLGIVLEPLKLPLEAVLVLFIAIDPILDPFRTLGIVHTGMAATAVIADPQGARQEPSVALDDDI